MTQKDNLPIENSGKDKALPNLSITDDEIRENTIAGDLNVGSTVVKLPSFDITLGSNALIKLIEKHEALAENSPEYLYVIEELQSKIKNCESRKVVGLKKKKLKI